MILMPDIIQRLKDAYAIGENADILHTLLPELFEATDEGKIIGLPCRPNNAYWHRNYDTGKLELNFEMHNLEEHDDTYPEIDACASCE